MLYALCRFAVDVAYEITYVRTEVPRNQCLDVHFTEQFLVMKLNVLNADHCFGSSVCA